ncbi:hypothetical protein [Cellulomonas edaphi]|uniref:Uncharacterized protein n=1 Tax=Cellulomonas edaphi TaxID=3053468 RepID=A0ABT7S623_9CELL|nr:hypothetical protein [Cellulomons edaphi]MDM7831076.1 hypothetical protein [Cellulomons edaphi]
MPKPAQTRASVSVGTGLPVSRVADLAAKAASSVDDPAGRVRVESRSLASVELSVRDHIEGKELMRFDVVIDRALGRTNSRTVISKFEVKGGVSSLMPAVKRKLVAFSAYEAYMDWFVSEVVSEDPQALVTLVSGE